MLNCLVTKNNALSFAMTNVDMLHQPVDVPLEVFQLVADRDEGSQHVGTLLCPVAVLVQHLAGGRELEAAHLHQIIDDTNLFNVLFGILTHLVASGLRPQMRKLGLPIAQEALVDIENLRYFLDGIVQFVGFGGGQCHTVLYDLYDLTYYDLLQR